VRKMMYIVNGNTVQVCLSHMLFEDTNSKKNENNSVVMQNPCVCSTKLLEPLFHDECSNSDDNNRYHHVASARVSSTLLLLSSSTSCSSSSSVAF
jgi:hypothetical protein